jgi:hypothetical protein
MTPLKFDHTKTAGTTQLQIFWFRVKTSLASQLPLPLPLPRNNFSIEPLRANQPGVLPVAPAIAISGLSWLKIIGFLLSQFARSISSDS